MVGGRPREREPQSDVHCPAECRNLDGRHADIVVGREHCVEFAPHCPYEYRVGRKRPRGTERRSCRGEHTLFLVAEEAGLSTMRIHGADRNSRLRDAVPLPQTSLGDLPRANDTIAGEKRRHIAERNVGGDQNHPERRLLRLARRLGGKHHGHVDIAG